MVNITSTKQLVSVDGCTPYEVTLVTATENGVVIAVAEAQDARLAHAEVKRVIARDALLSLRR